MDNYQMMRTVELEQRRRRKEERGRQQRERKDGQLHTTAMTRQRGPGSGRSARRNSREVQAMPSLADLIPSPTGSECSFMSDDEFRSHFRFGDADAQGGESREGTDFYYDEEEDDYYEEDEEDDEDDGGRSGDDDLETDGSDGEGLDFGNGGRHRSADASARRNSLSNGWMGRSLTQDDEHMAKWRKWDSKHHRGASDQSDEENEYQARSDMLAMLKATAKAAAARRGEASSGDERSPRRGSEGVVKRTRSASEKTEIANLSTDGSAPGIYSPQIKISGDWGEQWLRREDSIVESDDDDRIMLVPEFEDDENQGKIFFIPFNEGSGENYLPPRPPEHVQQHAQGYTGPAVPQNVENETQRSGDNRETAEPTDAHASPPDTRPQAAPAVQQSDQRPDGAEPVNVTKPTEPEERPKEINDERQKEAQLDSTDDAEEARPSSPHGSGEKSEAQQEEKGNHHEDQQANGPCGEAHDRLQDAIPAERPQQVETNAHPPTVAVASAQPAENQESELARKEQRRREKGKDKLIDDYDQQARSRPSSNEVRRATVTRKPSTAPTQHDPFPRKSEWVWDRDSNSDPAAPSSPRLHASGSETRSPRGSATKRSPLLAREDPPPLSASTCLTCTLS